MPLDPRKHLRVLGGPEPAPHPAPRREGDGEGVGRRKFLELFGASVALAGASACTRQPPEQIVPYVKQPEEIIPGRPLFYATSMICDGYATGLLAESHMGRPTKVEGNPEHPASLGATDAAAQASVLTLYDPDRSQAVTRLGRISTWERFVAELGQALATERAGGGAGIRILTETITSPSLGEQIRALLKTYPAAKWHRYHACGGDSAAEGARLAFGAPLVARYDLTRADVVLTLDADPLASGPGNIRYAHDFMARRRGGGAGGMNRLYAVESTPTCTGTVADHRLVLRAGEIGSFAMAVAAELGVPGAARPALSEERAKWAAAIAADLRARGGGRALVIAGEHASPAVHAIAHAINDALGAAGTTVIYSDPLDANPAPSIASLRELVDDMQAGKVTNLIVLGGNPVYNAPADIPFAEAMAKVPLRVHLSLYSDETSAYCHWHVPEAHYLEAWGDARAFDGTVSLIQPLIQPLYGGKSALELVAVVNGAPANVSGLDLLKASLRARFDAAMFEALFRKAVHDGFIAGTAQPAAAAKLLPEAIGRATEMIAAEAPGSDDIELILRPDPAIGDGQYANNGWLQELPRPHTKLTWDNAALISPAMAARLGLKNEDVVELAREGRSVKAPIYVLPGHPDGAVTVHLGYGRARSGRTGTGRGFNAYLLRTSAAPWQAKGLTLRPTGERYALAITQGHFYLEGRPHVRAATEAELAEDPHHIHEMGEAPPPDLTMYPRWYYPGHAWGMVVDIGACTGCSACVVACDAENNIPVVGKEQVIAQREMHWLRIDRYYAGDPAAPEAHNQPMMCVHCELAPCEPVCPVGATTHSADGLNEMTYNRCVGTRYCSNNCPYKVRRFNYFQFAAPDKSLKLLRNPDVTVRERGVMEKCTYCVQRIRAAQIDAGVEGRPIRDGDVVTACAQACPTGAIIFGDMNDPASRVQKLKGDPRNYGVLEELNTRPRTTYLAKIKNPNPALGGG